MSIELKIHNNLTRKKETFVPVEAGKVRYYSCGPTTYDFLHVGNARALVIGDIFHRVMKSLGYQVTFVRNFTDVDDKIIARGAELGIDPLEHAEKYVQECLIDMENLGMIPATHTPKVSETMSEIIKMIEDIITNGKGYVVDGEVFFDVTKADNYGKLSKKDLEGLQAGQRVEVDPRKKHPSDFVLWKPAKPEEAAVWDSPWGKGRPGWHIECSAMAKKFLGNTLDLHHGGVDLMFPHHENEIAQSEAANSCAFCTHWAHNEFVNFGSEKMSKSLGNVVTIRKFTEKYSGQVLRQILISVHYRARIDWSEEVIERAKNDVHRIHEFAVELANKQAAVKSTVTGIKEMTEEFLVKFKNELANDFNSAGALGEFFSFLRAVRRDVITQEVSAADLELVREAVNFSNQALGHIGADPQKVLHQLASLEQGDLSVDTAWVEKLLEERKAAKASKNWTRADQIRDELKAKSIVIKDNPDGSSSWSVIKG